MNLEKMYETQRALRERIIYDGGDRFEKLILALYTELGELANEWRVFKFWSKDQEPRTGLYKTIYKEGAHGPITIYVNPLLEEYVDGLHFIFELGIEAKCECYQNSIFTHDDVTRQFLEVNGIINNFWSANNPFMKEVKELYFRNLQQLYLGLGIKLGFTFEQIEQAYYNKNEINHQRQNEGY